VFSLKLFGGASIEAEHGSLTGTVGQPRRIALLTLLATASGSTVSRDKLIALLWPDRGPEQGRHLLSESLYVLRRALGGEAVLSEGDNVRLNAAVVSSDVREFELALERADLESAVSLYVGPFLDGFFLKGAPEFERWVDSERARLADRYAAALESLAETAESSQDWATAVSWWKRLAAHDPYNSRVALRLIEAMAAAGDPANALQHAREHERLLRQELGIEPTEDVAALVARLKTEMAAGGLVAAAKVEPDVDVAPTPAAAESAVGTAGAAQPLIRRNTLVAAVGILAVLVAGIIGYMGTRLRESPGSGATAPAGRLRPRERVVLADFENRANDSLLALALTEAFRTDLSQSPLLTLAEPDYVARVLVRMEREADTPLTAELAREVAIREGLAAVVAGDVSTAGTGFILAARLLDPRSGEVLVAHRETAEDSTVLISAIDRLSSRLREGLGESLSTLSRSKPLERVTTSSLPALRRYSAALRAAHLQGDIPRAITLFEEAIAFDTAFAAAYASLGSVSWGAGQHGRAVEAVSKAFQLRDRQTGLERYQTEGLYHLLVSGDMNKAFDAYRTLVEISDSTQGLNNLGICYNHIREHARAERLFRRRLEADFLNGTLHYNLLRVQIAQAKLDEAELTLRRWAERIPDDPWRDLWAADLADNRGDYDDAEAHLLRLREAGGESRSLRLGGRAISSYWLASLRALRGKLADAEHYLGDAMAADDERGATISYLGSAIHLALLDIWFRADTAAGIRTLEAVLNEFRMDSLAPLDRPYLGLALFYAMAGRVHRARELVSEYEAAVDPKVRGWEGTIVAQRVAGAVALAEGRLQNAIRELELADAGNCLLCTLPLLGRAYDLAGQSDSALAIYERYTATPEMARVHPDSYGNWLSLKDPYWLPLIYDGLAALYEQNGNTEKALEYYAKLVELWKDADPELQPRVAAARRAIRALSPDI
jgi:DNA-binding SARP family transcriptional activator/Tfp pilus assembly protein PilF/TolB-like protein